MSIDNQPISEDDYKPFKDFLESLGHPDPSQEFIRKNSSKSSYLSTTKPVKYDQVLHLAHQADEYNQRVSVQQQASLILFLSLYFEQKRRENKILRALELDNYSPYLPTLAYMGSNDTDHSDLPKWKQMADSVTTPNVIATIYRNLYNSGFIPSYEQPEDFVMISNGCNIPTYERLIFDLDREHRRAKTHVISIDFQNIPQHILSALVVGRPPHLDGLPFDDNEDTHQFINTPEEKFSIGEQQVDMIWNFRASLYYYLKYYYRGAPELIENARDILLKYSRELRKSGCVVVDAADHTHGKDPDTEMYKSTAELLMDFRDDLPIDQIFDLHYLGQEKAKILVLKKKPFRKINLSLYQ
jgi:hypothetical protein